jgi:hypothetical protein
MNMKLVLIALILSFCIVLFAEQPYGFTGTNGYDPIVKNMHGIFYAMGPNIKSNYQIDTFESVNVYPFICELLKIKPYQATPDEPEGKLEVLKEILVK